MDATLPLFDDYKVDLEAFEGPLDLLLHLIRKEEVDIYDIPIGRIAAQYMEYLDRMRALDINVAGEFVVMASTLMLIKSRMLLPREVRSTEDADEGELPDPRMDLVRRLIEYKRYKDAASDFAAREFLRSATYPRGSMSDTLPPDPNGELARQLGDIGTDDLFEAFRRILERSQATVSFGHLKMQRWSVPEKMQQLLRRVAEESDVRFGSLFPPDTPKGEIIVTFIALLELLRLRHVTVIQSDTFGELTVSAIPEDTPDTHLPLPAFDELDVY